VDQYIASNSSKAGEFGNRVEAFDEGIPLTDSIAPQ